MDALSCALTTPEKKVYEGPVRFVVVPAADGELGILPRHAPLVSSLGFGELRVDEESGAKRSFFVEGGFLQVLDDDVSILAATAVDVNDLDSAAEEASLKEIASRQLGKEAGLEAKEAHARSLAVARARLRLAKRAD